MDDLFALLVFLVVFFSLITLLGHGTWVVLRWLIRQLSGKTSANWIVIHSAAIALITIYASSTADIFINGVARSPWLPLILAALALAGVFGGIFLRIQAFLLLGSLFLLLAVTTIIYYASVNLGWTWLWYVAGNVTWVMIIFTFTLFAERRNEMLRMVEGLKEWER